MYIPNKTKNACHWTTVSAESISKGPTVQATFIDVDRALHTLANWLTSNHCKRYTLVTLLSNINACKSMHARLCISTVHDF